MLKAFSSALDLLLWGEQKGQALSEEGAPQTFKVRMALPARMLNLQ